MRLLASGGGGQSQHSLVASGGPLRIVQRMRLEPAQLEGVQRKIHQDGASCVCLALPAGNGPVELMQQTQILNDSFIRYMQEKVAAGIINVGIPDFQQVSGALCCVLRNIFRVQIISLLRMCDSISMRDRFGLLKQLSQF